MHDEPKHRDKSSRTASIVLNFSQQSLGRFYTFGHFCVDGDKRLLFRGRTIIPLPPKAFDVLWTLIRNNDRIVTKSELMDTVWPDSSVEESNLTQNVFLIRKGLGESSKEHRYIVTIPGRGYRFIASVRQSDEAPMPDIEDSGSAAGRDPSRGREARSIAVLPFEPVDAHAEDELLLASGMADAIIVRLSAARQLTVVAGSPRFSSRERAGDPLAVGRALGVDLVLDGKIQRSGDRIRVTVQAASVWNGSVLWAGKFDEQFSDIFTVQDFISEQTARGLALKLGGEEASKLTRRHTESTDAYCEYLKGRYFWSKRTAPGFRKAIACFERAIEKDPEYALAYSGLSDCYTLLSYYGVLSPGKVYGKARGAAIKALEIDSNLAEAHASLAAVRMDFERDWRGAEQGFKQAIELNPNYAPARDWFAELLTAMGRHDAALREIERAQELDPFSLIIHRDVGFVLYMARRYDQAIRHLRDTIEMDPDFAPARWFLGWAYERKGMYKEALAELQTAFGLSEASARMLAEMGYVYAISGRRDEALKVLEDLEEIARQRYVSPYCIALIHTGLGDTRQALAWLGRGYEDRSWELAFLKTDPRLDPLRSAPEFQYLAERMRLSP